MAKRGEKKAAPEVVCPHCGKQFEAELLSGAADRYQGYKCPHCRLFVAADRTNGADGEAAER